MDSQAILRGVRLSRQTWAFKAAGRAAATRSGIPEDIRTTASIEERRLEIVGIAWNVVIITETATALAERSGSTSDIHMVSQAKTRSSTINRKFDLGHLFHRVSYALAAEA